MKTLNLTTILALALATLTTNAAHAQSTSAAPKTRAEVRAETAAAIRTGDVSSGFEGLKMNELLPTLYSRDASRAARAADGSTDGLRAPVQVVAASAVPSAGK